MGDEPVGRLAVEELGSQSGCDGDFVESRMPGYVERVRYRAGIQSVRLRTPPSRIRVCVCVSLTRSLERLKEVLGAW